MIYIYKYCLSLWGDDPQPLLLTDSETNQNLQTAWSHQPFRGCLCSAGGSQCCIFWHRVFFPWNNPSTFQPRTPSHPLTSSDEAMAGRKVSFITKQSRGPTESVMLNPFVEFGAGLSSRSVTLLNTTLTDSEGQRDVNGSQSMQQCTTAFHRMP